MNAVTQKVLSGDRFKEECSYHKGILSTSKSFCRKEYIKGSLECITQKAALGSELLIAEDTLLDGFNGTRIQLSLGLKDKADIDNRIRK